MNYQLAKKLKDAGFPQVTQWSFVDKEGRPKESEHRLMLVGEKGRANLLSEEYDLVAAPILSELIEAVQKLNNDKDFHLECNGGEEWQASVCVDRTDTEMPKSWDEWSEGKTPEIALANLYLALHEVV